MTTFDTKGLQLWSAPGESSKRIGLAILCVALVAFFSFSFDNFFTASNALATALNLSSIAIAGLGTAILLIAGNVDLSIGGQWALGSMVVGLVAYNTQDAVLPVVVGLLLGLVMGLTNGLLVRFLAISPLIVTLGASLVFAGLAFAVNRGNSIYGFSEAFIAIGISRPWGIPVPVIVAALLFLVIGTLLVSTKQGLRAFAIGGNPEAAARNGIAVGRTVVSLYALNGVLIGIVSILTVSRLNTGSPQIGVTFALDVLTAVILGGVSFAGGVGHPIGVLVGVLTIGVLDTGLVFVGVEDWYQQITRGGILIAALVADQVFVRRRERARLPGSAVDKKAGTEEEPDVTRPGPVLRPNTAVVRTLGTTALECTNLSKNYGPVAAVRNASFSVHHGEIVCLVGDNGAGKSTVVKMISGIVQPSTGSITVNGVPVANTSAAMRDAGVHTVFQDLALCSNLSVTHNLVLGEEPLRKNPVLRALGMRDDRAAAALADEKLRRIGSTISGSSQLVRDISGGQRQSVAIARALRDDTAVMILDEPTAALGVRQTALVLETARKVAESGAGVIFITHDVEIVLAVSDRVVVMRDGAVVHDGPSSEITQMTLVHLMAGLGKGAA